MLTRQCVQWRMTLGPGGNNSAITNHPPLLLCVEACARARARFRSLVRGSERVKKFAGRARLQAVARPHLALALTRYHNCFLATLHRRTRKRSRRCWKRHMWDSYWCCGERRSKSNKIATVWFMRKMYFGWSHENSAECVNHFPVIVNWLRPRTPQMFLP